MQDRFCHDITVMLDAGHGGLDAHGRYTTDPKTGKFFDHKDKDLAFHGIPNNSVFYEGVFNRILANKTRVALAKRRISAMNVYHSVSDNSLQGRTDLANAVHTATGGQTIYFSLHSNASNSKGRGWEIFTSVGQTRSDRLATIIGQKVGPVFAKYGLPQRSDWGDGDLDRERDFWVLSKTNSPAALLEVGFFDNLQDAKEIDKEQFQLELSEAIADGINQYLNEQIRTT